MTLQHAYHPDVHSTVNGTPYLKNSGVVLLAQPQVDLSNVQKFLDGFNGLFSDSDYVADMIEGQKAYGDGATLVKFAGQLCYMSFGEKRSRSSKTVEYLEHIRESKHGSVYEHASYSFLLYGIDRAVTHEIVRHRAGFGFSQVSQRYVDGPALRFVMPRKYQKDEALARLFCTSIDRARQEYDDRASRLSEIYEAPATATVSKRKSVNQDARRCLPNETEAPIVITGNGRSWRHFVESRASGAADDSIREPAFKVGMILRTVAPALFCDYEVNQDAETFTTPHKKI